MMYKIAMHRLASKQLRRIPVLDRERTIEKLYLLAKNPDDSRLKIKKLPDVTASGCELEFGELYINVMT